MEQRKEGEREENEVGKGGNKEEKRKEGSSEGGNR